MITGKLYSRSAWRGRLMIFLLAACFCGGYSGIARAQGANKPRRETLLNGLRLILVQQSGAQQTRINLRLHAGAAFDLAGKEGTMALMGAALFPNPETRESLEEDLGGSLNVTTDFDRLEIALTGRGDALQHLTDILRNALINPPPDEETFQVLRAAALKSAENAANAPQMRFQQTAAQRFFGAYPYGRAPLGTPESIKNIQRSDVIYARERFLSPGSATLVVFSPLETSRVLRVVRQLLGGWRRADAVVPATFRQPDAPPDGVLLLDEPQMTDARLRLTLRGVARNDRDYPAVVLLSQIARERWQKAAGIEPGALTVMTHSYRLPGEIAFEARGIAPAEVASALAAARHTLDELALTAPAMDELEKARNAALAFIQRQTGDAEGQTFLWLDIDTYGLGAEDAQTRAFRTVTADDVRRAAFRLFRAVPSSVTVIGNAAQIKPELEKTAARTETRAWNAAPAVNTAGGSTATPNARPASPLLVKPGATMPIAPPKPVTTPTPRKP